jgi:hypothetical protein
MIGTGVLVLALSAVITLLILAQPSQQSPAPAASIPPLPSASAPPSLQPLVPAVSASTPPSTSASSAPSFAPYIPPRGLDLQRRFE